MDYDRQTWQQTVLMDGMAEVKGHVLQLLICLPHACVLA